jgi:hypothetical protein
MNSGICRGLKTYILVCAAFRETVETVTAVKELQNFIKKEKNGGTTGEGHGSYYLEFE